MLGTLTVLADGGIATGVLAQGGKVWYDKKKMGVVLVTGMALRRQFAKGSLLVSVPILFYLLLHHGASWLTASFLILALIPSFLAALSDSLLEVAPKLNQDIVPLQKNQVSANVGRLFLISLSVFLFPWAFVAVLGNGLPRIWANMRLRKISAKHADMQQDTSKEVRKEILSTVKRVLPGSVYYCLHGQISIWIISLLGTTTALADIGALGRLSMMLTIFGAIYGTLIIPRFARLPENKGKLSRRFFQILISVFLLSVGIMTIVHLFPSELLWILGKNYAGLEKELFISVAISCVGFFIGVTWGVCTGRNWIINPFVFIGINISALILGALFIDLSTLRGVLYFNLFIALVDMVTYLVYVFSRISKVAN